MYAVACDKARSAKTGELTLAHLELRDPTIVPVLRNLDENRIERELFREMEEILARRGLVKGKGLQKVMGRFLGISEATVSRKTKQYGDDR
jgi:hypothetical protein